MARAHVLLALSIAVAVVAAAGCSSLVAGSTTGRCSGADSCAPGYVCAANGVCEPRVDVADAGAPAVDAGAPDAGGAADDDGGGVADDDGGGAVDDDGGGAADDDGGGADGGADGGGDDGGGLVIVDGGAPPGVDAGTGAEDWWDLDWSHRVAIQIDGSGVAEPLFDVPVLVRLDATRFDPTAARASGADLRFIDDDGVTAYPFEVEDFSTGGTSWVWVRIPIVQPSLGAAMTMYWGNEDVPAPTEAEQWSVWSNGYDAVYHFGASLSRESSGHFADLENVGTMSTPGIIGDGRAFDGASDFLRLGRNLDIVRDATACTLSAWLKHDGHTDPWQPLFSISIGATALTASSRAAVQLKPDGAFEIIARTKDENLANRNLSTLPGVYGLMAWHQVDAVYDFTADQMRVLIDGVAHAESSAVGFDDATPDTPAFRAIFGADDNEGPNFLQAEVDEVRIERVARTESWLLFQQRSAIDAVLTFGPVEVR